MTLFNTSLDTKRIPAFKMKHALFLSALLMVGCTTKNHSLKPPDLYHQALATPAHQFSPGSPEETRALNQFKILFGNLSEENIREQTEKTYAPELFFYDTLKVLSDRDELEEYLIETARNTESVHATVEDIARSGPDYYLRWTMEIRMKNFQRGKTLKSVGVTHLRFDSDGKIILHHDYWDAASGFYEHVPVLGSVIRWIRNKF